MKSLATLSVFCCSLVSVCAADTESALAAVKEALTYNGPENSLLQKVKFSWMEQYQVAAVQPCGRNGQKLKQGGKPFDREFRRSWLMLDADTRTGTHFSTTVRVGGLPARYRYESGRERKDYTYTDIFEIWVQQEIATEKVKGLKLKLGKVSPLFTTDYITSASAIACTERSIIGGPQYGLDSNWGAELSYEPNDRTLLFLQLLANDRASDDKDTANTDVYRDGRGAKGEFGWEDKCFAIIGGEHKLAESEQGHTKLSLQYAHDFDNTYSHDMPSGANYFGMNVKDALSLGCEVKRDALTVQGNIIANAEMRHPGAAGNNNNLGWQLQPVYTLTPHIDLVARYMGMAGRDACKLGADHYITRHTDAPKWVDSIHSLYFGFNLALSAEDKNAAKLMTGAEYLHARKNGDSVYKGWEFTSSVRWRF